MHQANMRIILEAIGSISKIGSSLPTLWLDLPCSSRSKSTVRSVQKSTHCVYSYSSRNLENLMGDIYTALGLYCFRVEWIIGLYDSRQPEEYNPSRIGTQ